MYRMRERSRSADIDRFDRRRRNDDRYYRYHRPPRRDPSIGMLSKDFAMLLRYGRGWPRGLQEAKDGSLRLTDVHCQWAEPRGFTYRELVRSLKMNQYRYGDVKRWEFVPEDGDPTHVKLSNYRPLRDGKENRRHRQPYSEDVRPERIHFNRQDVLDRELDAFMGCANEENKMDVDAASG
eukprot:GEMP01056701.1.p1 GENE.GEMP01056701.1~~GEMP01056701.1.p1  ORF type:complete len:180 (+),score=19.87 GEMP01056701.1:130-669(+)